MSSAARPTAALVAALAIASLAACSVGDSDADHRRRAPAAGVPNIIAIVTDDQTLAQFNGRTMPETQRLLAERGTTFSDFIATTPLCCPSRATFLTGQYVHNNGVTSNSFMKLRQKSNILPAWLQRAGYQTAHVGKYLNNYGKALDDPADVPAGWDQWFTQLEPQRYYNYELSENGERVAYGSEAGDYLTRVLNRRAVDLIDNYARSDQPFYLQIDHFAPHFSPGRNHKPCRGAAIPDPDDRALLREAPALPASRSRDERDVSTKPWFIRELSRLDREERQSIARHYDCAEAALRDVDRGVQQVVAALARDDELERTVILVTSDNGYFYGEHRIRAKKEFPYEEAVHMPLIIRLPAYLRGPERVPVVDAPVANIDLAPTILALAKAEPCRADGACRKLDGRSLLPAMRTARRVLPQRRALLLELDQDPKTPRPYPRPCSYEGVRVAQRVLIRYSAAAPAGGLCRRTSAVEQYDLDADPEQLTNLAAPTAASPRARRERAVLTRRLDALRGCSGARETAVPDAAGASQEGEANPGPCE